MFATHQRTHRQASAGERGEIYQKGWGGGGAAATLVDFDYLVPRLISPGLLVLFRDRQQVGAVRPARSLPLRRHDIYALDDAGPCFGCHAEFHQEL